MFQTRIAIAPFIKSCPGVTTLGIRPAISDYSPDERRLMADADMIYFPTPRFAKIFEAAGKKTFPNAFSYRLRKSRVLQETFFQFAGCPHARTRLYFGRRKASIPDDFSYPFLAAGPNVQDRPALIEDPLQLAGIAERFNPLIVSDYARLDSRLTLVFLNGECNAVIGNEPLSGAENLSGWMVQVAPAGLDAFILLLSKLLRASRIYDIAVEAGFSEETGWLVQSLKIPPISWQSASGAVNRHDFIAYLIRSAKL